MASPQLIFDGEATPLKKRGLNKTTCEKYGYVIGKTAKGQTVQIAPYYKAGELVAQHCRTPDKDFFWLGQTKSPELFGQRLWRAGGKRLCITEGEIDCLTVAQLFALKWPVVSIPNGAAGAKKDIVNNLEWVESYDEVVIMFDMDEPGRKAAQEVAALLSPGKAKIAQLPLKDANELLQAGRGQEVVQAFWEAQPYRPDGIISGADLWDEVQAEPKAGLEIPFPLLQDKLAGLRKRELYTFTAGSGIGKTTFVNELAHHLHGVHEQKLGLVKLEEGKRRTAEGMMGLHLDKPLHITREGVTQAQLREAFEATIGSGRMWLYDHFGSTNIDNLMAKLRFMAVGLGVDWIVLDHISIVVSGLDESAGDNERKTLDKLMTKLRCLIEETGVGVLAIVHLKRPKDGKSFNEGRQVSLTDLRGSASIEQISDVVIALERNQQDEKDGDIAHLRVLKNRPIGRLGKADALRYIHETGRLILHQDGDYFKDETGGAADDLPF